MDEKEKFLIIDANSVIHRAYHALPPLTTKKGEAVGAVYGFLLVFFRVVREFRPDFLAACFDTPSPTFRHQRFAEYKAKRPPTAEDIRSQMPVVKTILEAFNAPILEKDGFEADDLIATLADSAGMENIILSGDSDLLQLVNQRTKVYLLRKGVKDVVLYDERLTGEKLQGLKPGQLVDFKALRGDPSDNIPGVPGIGEKTATDLVLEFGGLEGIYNNLPLIASKVRGKLVQNKNQAFLSRSLAEVRRDVPLDFKIEKARWGRYDREKITNLLRGLEFFSLVERIP